MWRETPTTNNLKWVILCLAAPNLTRGTFVLDLELSEKATTDA